MGNSAKMKITFILSALFIILLSIGTIYFKDNIYLFLRDNILQQKNNIKIEKNKYYRKNNYLYVQNTDNFIAKDKQDLNNIIYTILNSGVDTFTFYCDDSYGECIYDVSDIASDKILLSNINNFVHPYNSFKKIYISYNDYGEITVDVDKTYTENDINILNVKVKEIIEKVTNDSMNDRQKIKAIHDYIINNAKYASKEYQTTDSNYNTAKDILIDGYGLCSGYADSMSLFLNELGIENYKISSKAHIWNLVYLDGNWLHLDLTWDDPVTEDGTDKLDILFFLITDMRLKELHVEQHDHDENVYLELKK